jgi:aerotaxis receptor
MRVNSPVTQKEHPFPPGETLVSTTDLQGRILYCNSAFVELSGFSREELMGQPHNIVRHPDMPEEAFRDLWDTIKAGLPWSALVKNRRKNGDHYWVRANVTPLLDEQGQPCGVMSVRTEPRREDIQAVEPIYRRMREEGAACSLRLEHGHLLDRSPMGRLSGLLQMGVRGRITLSIQASTLLCLILGAWGGGTQLGAGTVLAGLLLSAAMAGLCSWYIKRSTLGPIEHLVGFANRIAAGDLTQSLSTERRDEIGRAIAALGQLNVNLMSIVRDARRGVLQMREGTATISDGNQDLSSRTESQASSLQQTASSMEEITSTVHASTDMAHDAAHQAGQAREVSVRGVAAVQTVAATMGSISEASRRIADIIQVVDSIAFQTNILALNAAVEAARAGEQGRGFAVVAAEVRALAQRTSGAAKEVRVLIQNSVERVSEGERQTEAASEAMQAVQHAVVEVHGLIERISNGMREQMNGMDQINAAVAQLDTLTQQNAAMVEEVSASALGLNQKAQEVADSVSVFKLKGDARSQANQAVALRRQAKAALQGG